MVHASHGVVEVSALGSGIQREECGIRFRPEACGREFGSSPRPAKAACACTLIEVIRRRTMAIGNDFNCGPLCFEIGGVPKCSLATLGAKNAALQR
jgi:hypothetical protein